MHLQIGNQATVRFDAYPGEKFNGTISEIAGISDPYTGTYGIEISLKRSEKKLLSGFIGEASIKTSKNSQYLSVPLDAMISANGDVARIFIVSNGLVKSRTVKIGPIQGDQLIVFDGLSEGEKVIVKGANYVSPNDSVNVEMD